MSRVLVKKIGLSALVLFFLTSLYLDFKEEPLGILSLDPDLEAGQNGPMASMFKHYDLIVIGGGINGVAIARDAALRGMSVLLLERYDYASGASSKSSKLAHGGVRYLEQWEFALVRESLHERDLLLSHAPHLVKPLPFLFPIYDDSRLPLWKVNFGLYLYDLLDLSSPMGSHRRLSKESLAKRYPALKADGLVGGCVYYDAQMQDNRIVIENVLSAREAGADLYNYTEVTDLLHQNGRVAGVHYRSERREMEGDALGSVVVNATGAWSNELLGLDNGKAQSMVRPTKGVHLVMKQKPFDDGLILTAPKDGRIFFLLPWGENSLLGTTDTDYQGDPAQVAVDEADIDYLLEAVNPYLGDAPFERDDVIASFAGLRPLVTSDADSESDVSRDHQIRESKTGLLSVAGGKYTTFRKIAQDVVDHVAARLDKELKPCCTERTPLYGGRPHSLTHASDERYSQIAQEAGLSVEQLKHLVSQYGSAYAGVLDYLQQPEPICGKHPQLLAELRYAIEVEQAMTLEDWYRRRTWIGYETGGGAECIETVAEVFAEHLGWDKTQKNAEIDAYVRTLR